MAILGVSKVERWFAIVWSTRTRERIIGRHVVSLSNLGIRGAIMELRAWPSLDQIQSVASDTLPVPDEPDHVSSWLSKVVLLEKGSAFNRSTIAF